jgi:hypothetical protein
MLKLSRRTFTHTMLGSLLTFSLVKGLDKVDALANSVKPVVRKSLQGLSLAAVLARR